jgi:nucleoside-diphosphate-sugar epimerase
MGSSSVPAVVIIGAAGAIGHAVAGELHRRHVPHRVVGRHRPRLEAAFGTTAEIVTADISDLAAAQRALSGTATAIYCVGLPYPEHSRHPDLFQTVVEAAQREGLPRLALVSSVYPYGIPQTPQVAETHPREPHTKKGQYRKAQEDVAMAAHGQRGLRTLVLRLPDFYGPHAELSVAGQVFGEAWNLGGAGTITGREFIAAAYQALGLRPRFRSIGPTLLRVGGWVSPLLAELREMYYLQTTPVILDDTNLSRFLGDRRKTPYPEGIRTTVEWYAGRQPRAA